MNQSNHSMQNVLVMENREPLHFSFATGLNRFTQTEIYFKEKSTSTNDLTLPQVRILLFIVLGVLISFINII